MHKNDNLYASLQYFGIRLCYLKRIHLKELWLKILGGYWFSIVRFAIFVFVMITQEFFIVYNSLIQPLK